MMSLTFSDVLALDPLALVAFSPGQSFYLSLFLSAHPACPENALSLAFLIRVVKGYHSSNSATLHFKYFPYLFDHTVQLFWHSIHQANAVIQEEDPLEKNFRKQTETGLLFRW
jgi:hypothetical protein